MLSFQNDRYPYSTISPWSAATSACAHLLVLQSHEDDFLHQRELGLFVSLCAFTYVPWVECDLMAIGGVFVGGLWRAVIVALRHGAGDTAGFVFAIVGGRTSSSSAGQTRCRGSHQEVCVERSG